MIWSTKCFYVMYKSGLNKLGPVVNAKEYIYGRVHHAD